MEPTRWLVVGLGNPGPRYARNRHNVGFLVADVLARRVGGTFSRHRRAVAEVCEARLGPDGPALVIAKPMAYMNLSGGPVSVLVRYYKIPTERLIAVYDEIDLPYGTIRAKFGGGEGGHNGARSLSRSLGTRDYIRVRFGVGRPPGRQDPADWVLSDFTAAERKDLEYLVDRAADFVEAIITTGLEPAQNVYHAP
ncbi:MAG TPA: aminoacyl-tRNA hydrolase [Natronosporangium sp.]|nr:aminoacyl-tRNA hydrolase [Natronosporangium sp.]